MNTDQIIIYLTEYGENIRLQIVGNDVWMNQKQLSEFFDTSKQNISNHIKNIFEGRELLKPSVVKEYLITGIGGRGL